jgi:hypothetical protein
MKTAYHGRKVSFELLPFTLYTTSTMLIPVMSFFNHKDILQNESK